MSPYFLLLILPALYLGLQNCRTKTYDYEKRKIAIDIYFIVLFFLLAFRGIDCGIDLPNYYNHYIIDGNSSWDNLLTLREPLFHLFNKLIYIIFEEWQLYLAFVAMFCLLPIWWFYRTYFKLPYLTIVLFCTVAPFPILFSGLRQSMAMAFVVPIYFAAKFKKKLMFFVLLFCATQFHMSAFILVFIYPLVNYIISYKLLLYTFPLLLLSYFQKDQIFVFMINNIFYAYGEKYGFEMVETGAYNVFILLIVFVLLSYLLSSNKNDSYTLSFRNILLFTVVLQAFASIHTIAMRFNYYFLYFVPLLMPRILMECDQKFSKYIFIVEWAMALFFTSYFCYRVLFTQDTLNVFPYKSFLYLY